LFVRYFLIEIRVNLLIILFHLLFKVRRETSNAIAHLATIVYFLLRKTFIDFVKRISRARYASENIVIDIDKKLDSRVFF